MSYPNRTYCDVLAECRALLGNLSVWNLHKTTHILANLLEELQVYGNRMEAGLAYKGDLELLHNKRAQLKAEVGALREATGKKSGDRVRLEDLDLGED